MAHQNSNKMEKKLIKNQKGVSTVEYIIVLVLIAVACIAMWSKFGKTVHAKIQASEQTVNEMEDSYGD